MHVDVGEERKVSRHSPTFFTRVSERVAVGLKSRLVSACPSTFAMSTGTPRHKRRREGAGARRRDPHPTAKPGWTRRGSRLPSAACTPLVLYEVLRRVNDEDMVQTSCSPPARHARHLVVPSPPDPPAARVETHALVPKTTETKD